MHGIFMRENREIPDRPFLMVDGPHREGRGRKPVMNGQGKSDRPVVPAKLPNNAAPAAAAEVVEGRGLAKGNTDQQNAPRTQSRTARDQCAGPCTRSSKEGQEGEVHSAPAPRHDGSASGGVLCASAQGGGRESTA